MLAKSSSRFCALSLVGFAVLVGHPARGEDIHTLRGTIVDAKTNKPIAARLYIQDEQGKSFHAKSAAADGSAVDYSKTRGPQSSEIHTTLSAHAFVAQLPSGKYNLTVERGKEYRTATASVDLTAGDGDVRVALSRWIDMSSLGWYSGETHVHRSTDELPTAMLADDLNVALPLTHWVTRAYTPPSQGDKNSAAVAAELVKVDATHVIYPLNTEYEIFSVDGKRHTLGAIFALNQKTVLTEGVPPVRKIAEQVHGEGALLELDKHNWPWSMMLVPVMNVDLYELTNNHIWRTEFAFRTFGESPAAYMNVEQDDEGVTEQGWLDFTFQNYYALLNCGFRLRPTAGTASGVHPVPLGFGRVYVHLPDGFSYEAWMKGLDAGRSFVTTGPMLVVTANDQPPGTTFGFPAPTPRKGLNFGTGAIATLRIQGWSESEYQLSRIEVVGDGGAVAAIPPTNKKIAAGSYRSEFDVPVPFHGSGWLAVRCFEQLPNGRVRFAHTAPIHIDVADKPLRPRKAEAQYLVDRVQREIERNTGVLSDDALAEFRQALQAYKAIATTAE
ncbi:MAG: CehA/McbA family metallohydrolase [Planctomycetes bacterium]|nr:CehA/McbA family metallohydrolase [Planctomycetota bacterium]